ncbi:MAG: hypothetical protein CVV27_14600 [Candidatus Melainabacteria bacterium HGW-Melainabacteria-1]|nr:MAG: hypothetical protein CVV27_14600 [Candidatus Melainabacteria bacterium HGW-Melainabacteria-1]
MDSSIKSNLFKPFRQQNQTHKPGAFSQSQKPGQRIWLTLALCLALSGLLPGAGVMAQTEADPVASPESVASPEPVVSPAPETIQMDRDTRTNLSDGRHQPVMKSYVRLGYQIDLFSEKLVLPGTELDTITAGGVVYHEPRVGGMVRLGDYAGSLEHAFLFTDYTFTAQPVTNQRTNEKYNRSTHFLDLGLGYFFQLVEDRIEIAPYLGMSAQFNLNDRNLDDQSVYYHANQNRLGFGLGGLFAVRFDDTLPFPLFLFLNLAAYPLTPVSTAATTASFPDNLTIVHLGGSFYGRFLPYLGGELGFRQQFHFGGDSQAQFSAAWSEFFAMIRFEPEVLFID